MAGRSLGLPAVGLPGANGWKSEWAPRFAGKQVRIVPDCDAPGRELAGRVAADLLPHAQDVSIIDLEPTRDDGYDIGELLQEAALADSDGIVAARARLAQVATTSAPVLRCDPLDGSALLDELAVFVRRFVVLTPEQADVVAVYVLHTHAFEAAETMPYLAITSAAMQSGKTRLGIEVLGPLVANALPTLNTSVSALFRSLQDQPHTVLFDEVDAVFKSKGGDKEVLRGVINGGYRRGAKALRCVGEGTKQTVQGVQRVLSEGADRDWCSAAYGC